MAQIAKLLTILVISLVYVQYLVCAQEYTECTNKFSNDKGICFTNRTQKCPTHEFAFVNGGSICKTENETYHTNAGQFYQTFDTYCCPHKEQFNETGRRAKAVCDYYNSQLWFWGFSFNGIPALIEEFPHMAALGYNETGNLVWGCSGSLISHTFVLTAAHCLNTKLEKVSFVRLSETNLTDNNDIFHNDYQVVERIAHPKYKKPSHYYDIGLIRTTFIDFFRQSIPACLYTSQDLPINKFSVTGWGQTDFIGGENTRLLKVALNLIPISRCRDRYVTASKSKLSIGIDEDTQFCAGHPLGNDPCPGDSGGPFQMLNYLPGNQRYRTYTIIDVTSFGKGCGQTDSIGVYTNVASFIRWIEDIVWPI